MCTTCQPDYNSILHSLYPGKPMQTWYNYSRTNIPNDHPFELAMFNNTQHAQLAEQVKTENQFALDEAGKYKVIQHPAVEPEATIEDPDLQYVTMQLPPNIVQGDGPVAPSGNDLSEGFAMDNPKKLSSCPKALPSNWKIVWLVISSIIIAMIMMGTVGVASSR